MRSMMDDALAVGSPSGEPHTEDAVYFEYTRAADPIADGAVSPVPVCSFGPELYGDGPSRVVALDLSPALRVEGPATGPGTCAAFVRVLEGETVETRANATSHLFYVVSGRGRTHVGDTGVPWARGDFVVLPAHPVAEHHGESDAVLYWVHDEPLLRYLGARADEPRFRTTKYRAADAAMELERVAADPEAASRSRISILLANRAFDQTLTVTHVLWAMFGILPADSMQPLHRHQSIALDFVVDCEPGCYSLIGDLHGDELVNVERVDWAPGTAFVTPPGRWHSHHNDSGVPAHIIPIQDAGLHTYLRTLDIRFMNKDQALRAIGTPIDISPANSLQGAPG